MIKFLAPAILALSAFSAQAGLCTYCSANGPSQHGLSIEAPGKVCTRNCNATDEPNGPSQHGLSVEAPGKVCTRNCNATDEPNGPSEHGLWVPYYEFAG